jgi:hypothetical protein
MPMYYDRAHTVYHAEKERRAKYIVSLFARKAAV